MSTIKADKWLNIDGTENYKCRAWVNFNGTGAGTPLPIRASGNVSSITDNGVGDYTINFATPMLDTNYSVCVSSHPVPFTSGTLNGGYGGGCGVKHPSTYLTTSVGVYNSTVNSSATASAIVVLQDTDMFNVAIFR